jgi:hypothetical protein
MNNPFWQELRSTVMLRGTDWREVVESLPGRIDASEVKSMLQSPHQLTHCNMQGVAYLAGYPVYASPDPEILGEHVTLDMTAEHVTLQWLYQFFIIEGLMTAMHDTNKLAPIAEWPPMILDMLARSLQTMVYMAALLTLMEEGALDACDGPVTPPNFLGTQDAVRHRVGKTTENLFSKAQDYGESFRRHGLAGLIPRLWDKVARIAQLKSQDRAPNFESMQDSARDLLGYTAIAWTLVLEVPAANNIHKVEVNR